MLTEGLAHPEDQPGPAEEPLSDIATASAAPGSLMEQLPRISDLIPRRTLSYCGLWFVGTLAIAGLVGLDIWMDALGRLTADGTVEAFDLDAEGSLGAWYSSLLLLLTCGVTLIIYAIRQRQVEDYQARYRIWLWAALCWLVMSIDETASLHEGFKELMTIAAGTRLTGDGSLWWVLAYAVVLCPVGLSLVYEMRGSWGARFGLALTAVCYVTAVAAQLEKIPGLLGREEIRVEEALEMAGNLTLLLSMALHARFVLTRAVPQEAHAEAGAPKKRRARTTTAKKSRKTTTTRKRTRRATEAVAAELGDAAEVATVPASANAASANTAASAKTGASANTASSAKAAASAKATPGTTGNAQPSAPARPTTSAPANSATAAISGNTANSAKPAASTPPAQTTPATSGAKPAPTSTGQGTSAANASAANPSATNPSAANAKANPARPEPVHDDDHELQHRFDDPEDLLETSGQHFKKSKKDKKARR